MTEGKPVLDSVTINSTDVNDYKAIINGKSWNITEDRSSPIRVKTATIRLAKKVEDDLTINNTLQGKLVTIQRGVLTATEEYIFRGHVVNVQCTGASYIITAVDKIASLAKRKLTKSYDINIDDEEGKFSEIFKSLINDYSQLTADATTVQDSGTERTIEKFICKGVSLFDACTRILETIGWQAYYNPRDDKVYMEPEGQTNQTTTLEVGVNIVKTPKWDRDTVGLFNKLELRGAVQEVETTESGQIGATTGYTTDDVTLTKIPESVKVYSDSGNPPTTLLAGGQPGATSSFDYYVDKENKKIIWNDTYTPGGSDYVEIAYSYFEPVPVVVDDETSIVAYSEDPDNPEAKEIVLHKPEITNIQDAETYARQWLDDHKDEILISKLQVTNVKDIAVGQRVYVIDEINDKTGYYQVTSIDQQAPYRNDVVTVASKVINENNYEWNTDQRIKRLEEQMIGDEGILLHVKDLTKTIQITRDSFTIERYKICDSFIVGHYVNGRVGMGTILDDFEASDANWTASGCGDTDSTDQAIQGSGSLYLDRGSAGFAYLSSTQSYGDLSGYTGTSSGEPIQGTIGLWLYITDVDDVNAINLRIGSSSTDYYSSYAKSYSSVQGYDQWENLTLELQTGWNYLIFRLTDGNITGTPDWTSVDYTYITIVYGQAAGVYIDYLTISKSNYIGLNGVGTRRMQVA